VCDMKLNCRWCYSEVTACVTVGGRWLCTRHIAEYNAAERSDRLERLADKPELLDIIRIGR
jgi:hypothetical protein